MKKYKMNLFFVFFIDFYRKFLSPVKGYKCAYGLLSGRDTCSGYGRKVFLRHPPLLAIKLLKKQFVRCQKSAINLNRIDDDEGTMVYDICGIPVCKGKDRTGGRGCG